MVSLNFVFNFRYSRTKFFSLRVKWGKMKKNKFVHSFSPMKSFRWGSIWWFWKPWKLVFLKASLIHCEKLIRNYDQKCCKIVSLSDRTSVSPLIIFISSSIPSSSSFSFFFVLLRVKQWIINFVWNNHELFHALMRFPLSRVPPTSLQCCSEEINFFWVHSSNKSCSLQSARFPFFGSTSIWPFFLRCEASSEHLYQLMPLKSFSVTLLRNWKIHFPSVFGSHAKTSTRESDSAWRLRQSPPVAVRLLALAVSPAPNHKSIESFISPLLAFLCVYSPSQIRSKQIKTSPKKAKRKKLQKEFPEQGQELLAGNGIIR